MAGRTQRYSWDSRAFRKLAPEAVQELHARLMAARVVGPATGCWYWTGSRDKNGHGKLGALGSTARPYRLAWLMFRGPLRAEDFFLHGFDDLGKACHPSCFNPNHSRGVGPQTLNMRQAVEDGNHWQVSKTHCAQGHEYSGRNLIRREVVADDGHVSVWRYCRTCKNDFSRRARAERTQEQRDRDNARRRARAALTSKP